MIIGNDSGIGYAVGIVALLAALIWSANVEHFKNEDSYSKDPKSYCESVQGSKSVKNMESRCIKYLIGA